MNGCGKEKILARNDNFEAYRKLSENFLNDENTIKSEILTLNVRISVSLSSVKVLSSVRSTVLKGVKLITSENTVYYSTLCSEKNDIYQTDFRYNGIN